MDKETVTLLVGFIGASAWLSPLVYEYFKKQKLVGKPISCITLENMTASRNDTGEQISAGIFYLYKLSVTSLGRNFHPMDVDVKVHYSNSPTLIGKISVPRNIIGKLNGELYEIKPPRELLFPNICVFQKDIAHHVYMPFSVDKATSDKVERVDFDFIDYNDNRSKLTIDFTKINPDSLMYEDIMYPTRNS